MTLVFTDSAKGVKGGNQRGGGRGEGERHATEAAAYAYIVEENESVVWAHIEVGLGMISDWP